MTYHTLDSSFFYLRAVHIQTCQGGSFDESKPFLSCAFPRLRPIFLGRSLQGGFLECGFSGHTAAQMSHKWGTLTWGLWSPQSLVVTLTGLLTLAPIQLDERLPDVFWDYLCSRHHHKWNTPLAPVCTMIQILLHEKGLHNLKKAHQQISLLVPTQINSHLRIVGMVISC